MKSFQKTVHILQRVKNSPSGFTLIELLVVIAVVGVLAGAIISIINPTAQLARARDVQRKTDIKEIKQAVEEYFIIIGSYPPTAAANWVFSTSADPWIPSLASFMNKIPEDPINNATTPWALTPNNYSYAYKSDGTFYEIVSRLENSEDSDRCAVKAWQRSSPGVCPGGSWCGSWSGQLYSTNNCNR